MEEESLLCGEGDDMVRTFGRFSLIARTHVYVINVKAAVLIKIRKILWTGIRRFHRMAEIQLNIIWSTVCLRSAIGVNKVAFGWMRRAMWVRS